jgi:CHAD domain-containing protein
MIYALAPPVMVKSVSPERRTLRLFNKLRLLAKQATTHPEAKKVHQLRTSIRRVETILDLQPSPARRKDSKLRKQLNRLRKRAGKVRDIDVQLVALQQVSVDFAARDKQRLERMLAKQRGKRQDKFQEVAQREVAAGLGRRLKRAAERLTQEGERARRIGDSGHVREALAEFAALVQETGALNADNLHAFRLGCKRARYVAEMAGEIPQARSIVATLKRVQDAIGEWHDWGELTLNADKVLRPESPLISVLRANTRFRQLEAIRIANRSRQQLLPQAQDTAMRKGPGREVLATVSVAR